MYRLLVVALVSFALASFPTQAAGPLVLIAKELVKSIVIDFIEARIADTIRASFGPCKADLAEDAIAQSRIAIDLVRGAGGPPNLGALGAAGNLGQLGSAAGSVGGGASGAVSEAAKAIGGADAARAAGALSNASNAMNSPAATRGMEALGVMGGQLGGAGGADLAQLMQSAGGMPGMAAGGIDMQQGMAMLQQMQNAKPLTPAELDELANMLERYGKIANEIEPGIGCSASDYRRLFARASIASADPRIGGQMGAMMGGMFRMMYTNFKDMELRSAEAEQTFSKMGPDDRAEFIDTTVADLSQRPADQRRAFVAMLNAGMLGLPQDMASTLRARLAA